MANLGELASVCREELDVSSVCIFKSSVCREVCVQRLYMEREYCVWKIWCICLFVKMRLRRRLRNNLIVIKKKMFRQLGL